MSADLIQFILSAAAIVLGGGFLAFLRSILPKNRRAELKTLDTKSDATTLESQNAYILTLQAGDKASREEVLALKVELARKEKEWDGELAAAVDAMGHIQREMTRCTAKIARLEADAAVAQAQIIDLAAQVRTRHGL